MAEKALQPWAAQVDSVPDFLRGKEPAGYDDVNTSVMPSVYRLSQALSDVVAEGKMGPGRFYESVDKEDLGDERYINIFRTRWVRQLMNPEGKSIACKAYRLNDKGHGIGRIRLYNKDDMPKEYIESWGLTQDELDNLRVKEQDCATCPFAQWTVDEKTGKNVPPVCKRIYELYFLDVTGLPEGSIDKIPHRFDIVESNSANREAIRDLDQQIIRRLRQQRVPIWGGFFRMSAIRQDKFYAPKFEFQRLMTQDEAAVAELAELMYEELNRVQEEVDRQDTETAPVDGGEAREAAPAMDVQEGDLSSETPWD